MREDTRSRTARPLSPAPTTRGLLATYLLIPATLVVLWAASEPILAATLVAGAVAGAVATVVLQAVLVSAAVTVGAGRRNRICIPRTGVCVEF